jgi:hypothetical protein
MADVNYGTQFLGFDDNGYQGDYISTEVIVVRSW